MNKFNDSSYLLVETIDEPSFHQLRDEWERLHQRSDADPLFLSWAWNWSWWESWNQALKLELLLITVRTIEGELVGIAPLYRHSVNYMGVSGVTRIQSVGNAWGISPTVRSEYMGLIVDPALELQVYQSIWRYLLSEVHWDELILCDLDKETRGYRIFAALARMNGMVFEQASEDVGVKVNISGTFRNYLQQLGRNTRLKLYNRRNRLEENSITEHIRVKPEQYPQFFEKLNELHATRWKKGCYTGLSEQFHLKLLSFLPDSNVHCMLMKHDGQMISALYDLECRGKRYNLQAGYFENYHSKVSLGTLHLGYGIEEAWNTSSCVSYDLLAGSGKHSFYKKHLSKKLTQFATVRITRLKKRFALYKFFERLPAKLRKKLLWR
ncbi:GNAT family N-acetyltransferase [Corallincola holothuriorum]|uniref:GNAT family N-acetyltransferase n=1 Tax=Corallincola holothuriorum TaxID=2282215 RepID=A0A368N7B2_9GAMM|nr:GNAT family N-acetyltransferase [Corallincola holothuriorum]RCU45159.1 GNAT family N-acetyltransferase [Corallincola holothuriorum]